MDVKSQLEELARYYRHRAPEYDAIYDRGDPVRQKELGDIADAARWFFRGRTVLEIACGTGYWTRVLAGVARHIVATDLSVEMLDIARKKTGSAGRVDFRVANAFELDELPGTFDGAMAGFWLSHVPRATLDAFLQQFHRRLSPGSIVFMTDNLYTPGYGGALVRREGADDTFKRREVSDGASYTITKNYFGPDELQHMFAPFATDLALEVRAYYWWLSYSVT